MTDWEHIVTRIGVIVICVTALYVSLQALSWNYITADEFLLILWAILAAWGVSMVGMGTYGLGKKSGYQDGYTAGLEYALKLKKSLKEH